MFGFFRMWNRKAVNKVPTYTPTYPVAMKEKEITVKAIINQTEDGRHAIVSGGQTVATYARKRDAVRGATRRGLTVLTV